MMAKRLSVLAVIIMFFITVMVGMNTNQAAAGDALAEESIDVQITAQVKQQLDVIEPIVINEQMISSASKDQESIVVEKAGSVVIKSNADWQLQIEGGSTCDYDVMVRRSDERGSDWQPVSRAGGDFQGSNGRKEIAFDVKLILDESITEDKNNFEQQAFAYTLAQN